MPSLVVWELPSLKLTFSPLEMDGWNTILSYWGGPFSGAMLVSGRVNRDSCANHVPTTLGRELYIYIYIFFFFFQTCSYPHLTGSEARIFRGNFTIKEIFRIMVPNHGEYHIGVCEKRATCWLLVVPNQVLAAGVSCTDEESRTPL